jgi:hypothetical protein
VGVNVLISEKSKKFQNLNQLLQKPKQKMILIYLGKKMKRRRNAVKKSLKKERKKPRRRLMKKTKQKVNKRVTKVWLSLMLNPTMMKQIYQQLMPTSKTLVLKD